MIMIIIIMIIIIIIVIVISPPPGSSPGVPRLRAFQGPLQRPLRPVALS